jgi:hypothetical protein
MSIRVEQVIDKTTGTVTREEHFKNGKLHRDGDQPAVIVRNATTGIVTEESYWKDNKLHRDGDQPARIERDATTGNVTGESYWKDGARIPAPAKRPIHDMGQAANTKLVP